MMHARGTALISGPRSRVRHHPRPGQLNDEPRNLQECMSVWAIPSLDAHIDVHGPLLESTSSQSASAFHSCASYAFVHFAEIDESLTRRQSSVSYGGR